eukprot:CAMPEP_0183722890 /NCGR_PEP_ID=MMETSP0737-20130205/14705_1 /TAXON_ID=385413 /ORGANISM="Thalassiosira miniscula, Strain CCMP1093" /LENGTH=218 /DNA_ID=CAMNT_0025953135 /DNA_START=43 /DNA_END=699 /DNA_ORIENTATION=+
MPGSPRRSRRVAAAAQKKKTSSTSTAPSSTSTSAMSRPSKRVKNSIPSKKSSETKEPQKETKPKQKMWTVDQKPAFVITAPPGPLGLTIKQYADEFIIQDISETCAIPEAQGDFPKIREGDVVIAIDGEQIDDDSLKDSDKSRVIGIGGRVISNNAAEHSKGSLLWMKESGCFLFRIMDYSDVAEKYGAEFLEELNPKNKGKSGKRILAGAMNSLSGM